MTANAWRETRVINGVPYTFTWDAERNCWKVTAGESPTDRFWRCYSVYCTAGGTPLRCSCADCHHRKSWCKHLKEAQKLQYELNPQARATLEDAAIRCGAVPTPTLTTEEI